MQQEDFPLVGDFTPTQLDQSGITLVAPGLQGRGRWHSRRYAGETRAGTAERSELDQAIAESGAEDRHTLLLEAPTPPGAGGVRSVGGAGGLGPDELLLQVPLARDEAALVLYVDEAGVLSFHYPQPGNAAAPELPSRAFGAGRQLQFRLRLRAGRPRAAVAGTGERGLFSRVAGQLVKVLVVKLFPDPVGGFAARRVQAWEQQHRAWQGLHGGSWAQLLDPRPTPVGDLARFAGRRSLLLIHGTTSTTAGAFAGLAGQPALLDRLDALYEGRVLGFNHHTMSCSVADNVRQFHAAFAEAPGDYCFDILCHSRGGLLARALAHLPDTAVAALSGSQWQRPAGARLLVGRIVFVATPNAGTALADPERIPAFVERLANYVHLLPDAALTIASGALLSLAGAVAEVGLPRLPGLADQAPGSPLQQRLAPPDGATARYHAFCSDYESGGDLLGVVKDAAADRIFAAAANDLVVPTDGVARTPHYQLPPERVLRFERDRHVHHSAFFSQPELARVAEWFA
jgi:hypothetical protein